MLIIDDDNLQSHNGKMICIYSDSAVGKTVNTLATAPDPVLWITSEPRDFQKIIEVVAMIRNNLGLPKLKFVLIVHEKFEEMIKFLNNIEKGLEEAGSKYHYDDFKTVFFDGLSYFHNISIPGEIQQFDYENKEAKGDATMRNLMRIDLGQKGDSNQAVFRVLRLLALCAANGKVVIISCLETERPRWDREQEYGPVLGGKEVPANFPGLFDLAGRLTHRYKLDSEGNPYKVYPPLISFDEGQGFWAKYTGVGGKKEGPLNWSKILGSIEGENKTSKKKEKVKDTK